MPWGLILLTLAACYAVGMSGYLHRVNQWYKYLALLFAAVFLLATSAAHLLQPLLTGDIASFIVAQVQEWGRVYCIAFILSALMLFVRRSKPEFSRFPLIYAATPFVILLSYLLVYNTVILKEWLLNIYMGGAVIVAVLMYGVYSYQESVYRTTFAGSLLFLITYLLYIVMPPEMAGIWQISLALSIATAFTGYWIVQKEFESSFT